MSKTNKLDWEKAREHLEYMQKVADELAKTPGVFMGFYNMQLEQLRWRLDNDVRTKALYDEIMDLS